MNKVCGIVLLKNSKQYIQRFLEQDLKAFDHIFFCDNEGNDGTYKYLAERFSIPKVTTEEGTGLNPKYTQDKFTFVRKRYTSPINCYNTIMAMINTHFDYIGLVDVKSIFADNFFETCINKLVSNNSISCVFTDFYRQNQNLKRRIFVDQIDCEKSLDDNIKNLLIKYPYIRNGAINDQHEDGIRNIVMHLMATSIAYHIPKPLFTEIL